MVRRLSEKFAEQEAVEIFLKTVDSERWTPGVIETLAFPGVWVRTEDGKRWFVTNGRRIRSVDGPNEE